MIDRSKNTFLEKVTQKFRFEAGFSSLNIFFFFFGAGHFHFVTRALTRKCQYIWEMVKISQDTSGKGNVSVMIATTARHDQFDKNKDYIDRPTSYNVKSLPHRLDFRRWLYRQPENRPFPQPCMPFWGRRFSEIERQIQIQDMT